MCSSVSWSSMSRLQGLHRQTISGCHLSYAHSAHPSIPPLWFLALLSYSPLLHHSAHVLGLWDSWRLLLGVQRAMETKKGENHWVGSIWEQKEKESQVFLSLPYTISSSQMDRLLNDNGGSISSRKIAYCFTCPFFSF